MSPTILLAVRESSLRNHGVRTSREGHRLMALDVVVGKEGQDLSQWVDVTDWSTYRLNRWLGY